MSYEKKFRNLDKRMRGLFIKHENAIEIISGVIKNADKEILVYKGIILVLLVSLLIGVSLI